MELLERISMSDGRKGGLQTWDLFVSLYYLTYRAPLSTIAILRELLMIHTYCPARLTCVVAPGCPSLPKKGNTSPDTGAIPDVAGPASNLTPFSASAYKSRLQDTAHLPMGETIVSVPLCLAPRRIERSFGRQSAARNVFRKDLPW